MSVIEWLNNTTNEEIQDLINEMIEANVGKEWYPC